MALAKSRRGPAVNYWPGYVDMLSTLLLVVTFLMSLFMLSNYFITTQESGKDTMLSRLNRQLSQLTELLALERSKKESLEDSLSALQATLVDTWASTAAGAFALSENNLYTTDAFLDYLRHVTDDGIVAFTRWGFEPPRESLRLVSLAIEALERLENAEPWRHVIVVREGTVEGWGALDTVLIARRPFSSADIDRTRQAVAQSRMEAVYLPDASGFAQSAARLWHREQSHRHHLRRKRSA